MDYDSDGNGTYTYEDTDEPVYGSVSLKKTGETLSGFEDASFVYENDQISGAVYGLYAKEDIQKDDGTLVWKAGTLIDQKTTLKDKGIVLAVMFGVPLLLIALKEPLTNKIKKKTEKMEQSKAMFVTQAFFELFETLLSYFSNTLSFIRIGAFAVSHASIMEVVLMLAGAESGHINWVVIVLGNLFVCGFEGLIVGIQVLRLVYYEMFSRFYKGSGREFKPYTGTAKN